MLTRPELSRPRLRPRPETYKAKAENGKVNFGYMPQLTRVKIKVLWERGSW